MASQGGAAPPGPPSADLVRRPIRTMLFALEATPGVWLGIAGYALFLAATLLPWYYISVRAEGTPFDAVTTIVQFDGVNGLYVHPDLRSVLGFSAPSLGFPVAIFFVVGVLLKVRKVVRSSTNKMRAGTLFRSSIYTVLPAVLTIAVIAMIPSLIPADAPAVVKTMALEMSGRPLGGSSPIVFHTGVPVPAELHWGFGPALFLMVLAAVLMNLGSQLELRFYRRAHQQMLLDQAER